tara:strand:- start:710 stop:1195 length:486 start_codon:yes stop_codon:yes gene_type:complete
MTNLIPPTTEQAYALYKLLAICAIFIFISGNVSYSIYKQKNPKSNFNEWFNGKNFSFKSILVGMCSGIIFGFIDNAGLWYGMSALDPYIKYYGLGTDGSNAMAGWGNTFSDAIGASMGTFIGSIIIFKSGIENTPIWADIIGIIIGCILGIYIPKAISGDS